MEANDNSIIQMIIKHLDMDDDISISKDDKISDLPLDSLTMLPLLYEIECLYNINFDKINQKDNLDFGDMRIEDLVLLINSNL